MLHHWKNLKYIVRHKWYVLLAGLHFRVWWHQLLLHDWTKFTPLEWFAYARHFYTESGAPGDSFVRAWASHIRWNPHHWQYWVVNRDNGREPTALEMPERFVREMVADWCGAGKAQGKDKDDLFKWYYERSKHIILHPRTRRLVQQLIDSYYTEDELHELNVWLVTASELDWFAKAGYTYAVIPSGGVFVLVIKKGDAVLLRTLHKLPQDAEEVLLDFIKEKRTHVCDPQQCR